MKKPQLAGIVVGTVLAVGAATVIVVRMVGTDDPPPAASGGQSSAPSSPTSSPSSSSSSATAPSDPTTAAARSGSVSMPPVGGSSVTESPTSPASSSAGTSAAVRGVPALEVTRVVDGLDHPWDVQPLGDGRLMLTQRERASVSIVAGDRATEIGFPSAEVWVSGETGLMGLEVAADFATSGRFFTCHGANTASGGHDVRVVSWLLPAGSSTATKERDLITGFPTSSGRHGGCRLLIATDGSLYVGTGDAAQGTNPQDLTSLGGKVLRLDPATGEPWPDNPFATAENPAQRFVHSFGHRNVQGLAERSDGTVWSVEHGSFRDDEVNRLVGGGDYGWNPVPDYNEQVPMTDQDLPGTQIDAAWSSGESTIAPGGATFIAGDRWGDLDGALAMAVLKDQQVLLLTFDAAGALTGTVAPEELQGLGRIRTVVQDTGGDLLVTTDNGGGEDVLYRVSPR